MLGIDTHLLMTLGLRQLYSSIGDHWPNSGPSLLDSHSPETYQNSHLFFNVPEEVNNDEDLEVLLEEEGFYLGSLQLLTIDPC
jgi:hypothetical protein